MLLAVAWSSSSHTDHGTRLWGGAQARYSRTSSGELGARTSFGELGAPRQQWGSPVGVELELTASELAGAELGVIATELVRVGALGQRRGAERRRQEGRWLRRGRVGDGSGGAAAIGVQIQVKIVKNKHAPPFKTALLELEFGKGLGRESELIELGCKHKFITKSGVFYHMNGQSFQGKDGIKRYLSENRGAQEDLMTMLREKMAQNESQLDRYEEGVNLDKNASEEMASTTDEEVNDELEA
nr:unnamed protein product [Digitaria exilis]